MPPTGQSDRQEPDFDSHSFFFFFFCCFFFFFWDCRMLHMMSLGGQPPAVGFGVGFETGRGAAATGFGPPAGRGIGGRCETASGAALLLAGGALTAGATGGSLSATVRVAVDTG